MCQLCFKSWKQNFKKWNKDKVTRSNFIKTGKNLKSFKLFFSFDFDVWWM
jgi:hypothetical protein